MKKVKDAFWWVASFLFALLLMWLVMQIGPPR